MKIDKKFIIDYARECTSATKHYISYPLSNLKDVMYRIHWMNIGQHHSNLKPTKDKALNDMIDVYYKQSLHKVLAAIRVLEWNLYNHDNIMVEDYATKFLTESNTSNIKRYLQKYTNDTDNIMKAVKDLRTSFREFCFPTIKDLCKYWDTYPRKYIAWKRKNWRHVV